ncbi:MAG: sugar phosphate isomerase/epimerase family protein [Alphaproteobacteria bacterium]
MAHSAYPYAINTYSYTLNHSARDCIWHLASQGYTDFELMMYPGHCWPADVDAAERRQLSQLLEERKLRILTLNMPNIDLNVAGAAKEMRDYTRAILRRIVELAGDLGVPGVVIGPGKANPLFPAPRERLIDYFYEALDELTRLAERAGTRLLVENMPFAFLPDADGLMWALDEYGNDKIGVVYDVANGFFIKEDLGEGLRRVKDRLALIHLSDTGLSVYRHDPVGEGEVPFEQIPGILRDIGYTQLPMLEIISVSPDEDIRDSIKKLSGMGWSDIAKAS